MPAKLTQFTDIKGSKLNVNTVPLHKEESEGDYKSVYRKKERLARGKVGINHSSQDE